jgi:hypothetical protein
VTNRHRLVFFALGLAASTGIVVAQPTSEPTKGDMETAVRDTQMGPVCWAAILEAVSQVGLRCVEDEDPLIREALDHSNEAMGQLLKGRGGLSEEYLEGFRAQMGEHDTPAEELCAGDGREFYDAMAVGGPDMITLQTQAMLERKGVPEWGTCL